MSDEGKKILELFQQTRKVCQQFALLLSTAEAQMEKKDWEGERTNAISDMSKSVLYPSYWIPIAAFRLFNKTKCPNRLGFISILIDDHWDAKYVLKEPIITAGFFDYGKGKVNGDWEYSFTRIYGYLAEKHNLKPDGEVFHFSRSMVSPSHKGNFKSGVVFALPLVSIENSEDIKLKITDKLLNLIESKG